MIARVVSIKELRGNPRMCLSANRVFNRCYECPKYEKCNSRKVNRKAERILAKIETMKEKNDRVNEEHQKAMVRLKRELHDAGD